VSDWLTSADAAWLHMDRPTNLMVINVVFMLDEPLDFEQLKGRVQERLVDEFPKFRKRVVESPLVLLPARWSEDPDFAINHHMHHVALPAPGDDAALREFMGDVMTQPIDRSRPLWHVYLIDNYGEGCALLVRIHHCVSDGITLGEAMLGLVDAPPSGSRIPPKSLELDRDGASPFDIGADIRARASAGGAATSLVRQGTGLAVSPGRGVNLAKAVVRDGTTAIRLVVKPPDADTAFKGDPGVSRLVTWTSGMSLPEIKRIAHAHGGTVNDVVLSAVAGALRHYLQGREEKLADIQAMVPFNLRPADAPLPRNLGNHFGLVFLPLPVTVSGSLERLLETHSRMEEIKSSREGAVTYGLLAVTGMTPEPIERRVVDIFTSKVTAVMTNVPGPRVPVSIGGSPISTIMVWAPTSGHLGLSVAILSYCDSIAVGLVVDAALIPDPDRIIEDIEREVAALGTFEPSVS
jgi:diacylglycerol O-acyltransferase / wax synthase